MPIPATGAVSLGDIRTELGASGAISLNDTNVRRLFNQTSGTSAMSNARGSAWIGSNRTNLNLMTLFSNPATAATYKVAIAPSINVDATAGNTALVVGQFPTGSTIQINNYGNIRAYGGAGGSGGAGSSGGDAIYASYANQTVTINNQTGAVIYGGGGGGGRGGNGGNGGNGGGGYYGAQTGFVYYNGGYWMGDNGTITVRWNGNYYYFDVGGDVPGSVGGFVKGAYREMWSSKGPAMYEVAQQYTAYTSGGSGGGGGAGGAGGRGQGADGASVAGTAGVGGSPGSGGGTNAGAGGNGGAGGAGGSGGTWGAAGGNGVSGATGNTGASGNNGGGSAGAAGVGGSSGGTAGRYLVKGANSVTLNNSGTVAGGLA